MLDAKKVDEIFMDCLFKENEVVDGKPTLPMTEVLGIVRNFGFHIERLESHRREVQDLLRELPDNFRSNEGGGRSFLQACLDRHDNHWGEHMHMEQLFSLGIGLGIVTYLMDRELWPSLPGGMPYIAILMDKFTEYPEDKDG